MITTYQGGPPHFSGRVSYLVFLSYSDQELPDVLALAIFSVCGLTIFYSIPITDKHLIHV